MEDAPINEPVTCIQITHDQASSFQVGDEVSIVVSGEVKGINEAYGIYFVELKRTAVSIDQKAPELKEEQNKTKDVIGHSSTPADYELERMLGE